MAKPKVFVAYPYSFSKADYRRVYRTVGQAHGVEFTYADARITNRQILDKIVAMIAEAEFSIFDITTWNANVALELGIAIGAGLDYYIAFNPSIEQAEVPSDVGGIDRLQYTDYAGLEEELSRLMRQQFGTPLAERDAARGERAAQLNEHLQALSTEIPAIVGREPGLGIGGIASALGVSIEVAQPLVRPMIGDKLRTEGAKRGTKYFPVDE